MHIEMGDDGNYSNTGIGTVTFQRQSCKPFLLKDVMHVPGLKKNLVLVLMLDDTGYDVVFSEGKFFLRHKAIGKTNKIGICVKNIYKLDVEHCTTLMGKVDKVVSQDEGELWHKRLGHLHHGALKIMQQISTVLPEGTLAQIDTCKGCTMGKCEKAMQLSLGRELDLHADQELLVPKDEPHDVKQPQNEDHGVEENTHVEKFRARWAEGVHAYIPPGVGWGNVQQ